MHRHASGLSEIGPTRVSDAVRVGRGQPCRATMPDIIHPLLLTPASHSTEVLMHVVSSYACGLPTHPRLLCAEDSREISLEEDLWDLIHNHWSGSPISEALLFCLLFISGSAMHHGASYWRAMMALALIVWLHSETL